MTLPPLLRLLQLVLLRLLLLLSVHLLHAPAPTAEAT
jgi:hypothetical protein